MCCSFEWGPFSVFLRSSSESIRPRMEKALWSATNRWYVVEYVSQKRIVRRIRTNGAIFESLTNLNPTGVYFSLRLKYVCSVISVIDKRLPGHTKVDNCSIVADKSVISPSLGGWDRTKNCPKWSPISDWGDVRSQTWNSWKRGPITAERWNVARRNISTWREVVEFRWDTQNTQTLPYK